MLEVAVLVDAQMKDAPGVKELICMALDEVPGVRGVRVMEVKP